MSNTKRYALVGTGSRAGMFVDALTTTYAKAATLRIYPMFGESYEVDVPVGEGGHGGADPVMLHDIFASNPPADPFQHAATHLDGAASILVGISGNLAMQTKQQVHVPDLFQLPKREK